MTETRKWTLGAVLIAIVVVAAGWFLLISPQRATAADLQAQTEEQQSENSSLATDIEVLQQQNKELPEKQAELAALQTKIPDAPLLPTYIRELQDLGRKSGVSFTSVTPSTPVGLGGTTTDALTPETLAAINVDMVVGGTYFEVTKFINELETSSRYTLVSGYSIAEAGEDTDSASASAGPTSLVTTINARIYLVPATPELPAPTTSEAAPAPTTTP